VGTGDCRRRLSWSGRAATPQYLPYMSPGGFGRGCGGNSPRTLKKINKTNKMAGRQFSVNAN